jgi:DNA end-binding protein Ku
MAAVWKGMISFGLVNIPVELQGAVIEHRPRFKLLHSKDRSPVSYERVCQREGKAVAWQDLVKGYEYSKGKFVVLTKQDFEAAAIEKTRTIDILDFVAESEIDDRFFDTSYYAVPGKGGARGYTVLREAIRAGDRVGIGKFVMRESQHLVALYAVGDALVLTTMRFADELVDVSRYNFPSAREIRPKELEMAKALVENLAAKWEPEKYKDEYRENLMRVIQAKVKGTKPDLVADEAPEDAGVIDLMERLRRSLEGKTKIGKQAPRRSSRSRAKPRRAA